MDDVHQPLDTVELQQKEEATTVSLNYKETKIFEDQSMK